MRAAKTTCSHFTSEWLWENVMPHLPRFGDSAWKWRDEIKTDVLNFCYPEAHGEPEFRGYYADYDWVVFCRLFGTMMDLPQGFLAYCRDVKQWADTLGNPTLPSQDVHEHDALADARHHRVMWQFLQDQVQTGSEAVR
jgi:3' exoribonuclease, RNase T-like